MTPWSWWWIAEGEDRNGGWEGDCDTREAAIADAVGQLPAGIAFHVIEARSSTAMQYEGAECDPFLRTRNEERLVAGHLPVTGAGGASC